MLFNIIRSTSDICTNEDLAGLNTRISIHRKSLKSLVLLGFSIPLGPFYVFFLLPSFPFELQINISTKKKLNKINKLNHSDPEQDKINAVNKGGFSLSRNLGT